MRERVLIVCVAGFLLGVFYASFLPLSMPFVVALLGSALIFLFAAQFVSHARPLYVIFFCCALVAGAARFDIARITPEPTFERAMDSRVTIEGVVVAEPDVRERSVRLTVRAVSLDGRTLSEPVRVLTVARPYTHAGYGDTVRLTGTLVRPRSFETGTDRTFDYASYLAVRGISYQINFADVETVSHGGNPFIRAALFIKSVYVHGLRLTLPEPYAGLAAGITAGDKRSVGTELSDTFIRVSLVHILVLSGYNITVVMGALIRALRGAPRTPRIIASLAVVLFFILISGAAASSVRAGAMAFAVVFANMYGRQFVALRVLTMIVVSMVAWNPYVLMFDPGFQLSVLATLGLILFAHEVAERLRFITEHYGLRDIVASTVATQAAVLPLLLYQNGMLSLVALPANILALVAVPLAMACSVIAALAGIVLGTWGTVLALPAYILLRYIVVVAETFSRLPFAAVQIPAFSGYIVIALYAALFGWIVARSRAHRI